MYPTRDVNQEDIFQITSCLSITRKLQKANSPNIKHNPIEQEIPFPGCKAKKIRFCSNALSIISPSRIGEFSVKENKPVLKNQYDSKKRSVGHIRFDTFFLYTPYDYFIQI